MAQCATDLGDRVIFKAPIEYDQAQIEGLAEAVVAANGRVLEVRGFNRESAFDRRFLDEATGKVEAVLNAAFGSYFGVGPAERYDDLFEQICDFAEKLAKDHIFFDGNKRTTVKVSLGLLLQQGIELDLADGVNPEDNELYEWIEGLVTGRVSKDHLAAFLRERTSY